jgi:hypothetical protein
MHSRIKLAGVRMRRRGTACHVCRNDQIVARVCGLNFGRLHCFLGQQAKWKRVWTQPSLSLFSAHIKTGEPIPIDLGRALNLRQLRLLIAI